MIIGFVVNQIKTEEPWYDTTLLTWTAVKMGHEVYVMGAGDMVYSEDGHVGAIAVKVCFKDGPMKWSTSPRSNRPGKCSSRTDKKVWMINSFVSSKVPSKSNNSVLISFVMSKPLPSGFLPLYATGRRL